MFQPPRRLRLGEGGDVVTVEGRDDVARGRVGRRRDGELPAEQAAVELLGGVDVGLLDVDPAGHSVRVGPVHALDATTAR